MSFCWITILSAFFGGWSNHEPLSLAVSSSFLLSSKDSSSFFFSFSPISYQVLSKFNELIVTFSQTLTPKLLILNLTEANKQHSFDVNKLLYENLCNSSPLMKLFSKNPQVAPCLIRIVNNTFRYSLTILKKQFFLDISRPFNDFRLIFSRSFKSM